MFLLKKKSPFIVSKKRTVSSHQLYSKKSKKKTFRVVRYVPSEHLLRCIASFATPIPTQFHLPMMYITISIATFKRPFDHRLLNFKKRKKDVFLQIPASSGNDLELRICVGWRVNLKCNGYIP